MFTENTQMKPNSHNFALMREYLAEKNVDTSKINNKTLKEITILDDFPEDFLTVLSHSDYKKLMPTDLNTLYANYRN